VTSASPPALGTALTEAEKILRNEKLFSETLLESMPGIMYFYDSEGRFLRWNRNFERVSGYSSEEIASMHPLDFFAPEHKARLQERIGETFSVGESSVEAPFLTKQGASIPYLFTGRRVEFDGQPCLLGVGIDITARTRAEEQLAQSERKYRELVEHANSIILRWDRAGRVTFLNEFGLRFFGYTEEEITGRHVIGTLVPETETSGRDLERLIEEICAAPLAFERNINENVRRNGERVWISWTNRIERDAHGEPIGILSIGSDITASREAEERVRRSEAHLIEAQRIAKIGSWELDLRTNRIKWSGQTAQIYGLRESDSAGTFQGFLTFVHPDDLKALHAAQRAALEGTARFDIQHRIVLRDGTEKVVHQVADVKRENGVPVSLAGTVHDITDRVRIEAERERRHRAEAADRVKSAFLATMSHELRTPLNSIIGFTGILLQELAGPLNAEQRKQLEMVRTSSRHLLALVNDVLDISKIEAEQLVIAREPFDVTRSIEKVLSLVTPQAREKGLAMQVSLTPDLGQMIGDQRRFEQILLNLLSNAIKFTEHGEVGLTTERQSCDAVTGQPALTVRISDTGPGIKPSDLEQLFEPFRQVDSGLARKHEGTGLGLAICRRLADLMGGRIDVESEWGKGSTFSVTLPFEVKGNS
jgi:PAS domain S-box-containing protein